MSELGRLHGEHVTSSRSLRVGWDRLADAWRDASGARYDRHHEQEILAEAARFDRALATAAQTIAAVERELL